VSKEKKIPIALFGSAVLNEKKTFLACQEQIGKALEVFDPKEYEISIGKLKNKLLIEYVKGLGYDVNIISQHPKSLLNSNKKIIREHVLSVFLIHHESSIMMELLSYAQAVEGNATVPIHLSMSVDDEA